MTETSSPEQPTRQRRKRRGRNTGVGMQPHKRTGIDIAIAVLTPIVGQEFLDKHHLRDPLNKALRYGTKTIFSAQGARARQFGRVRSRRGGRPRLKSSGRDYFGLTPDEDQKLIIETV